MNTNKGGRPRNAWTSSRRRKLVRLYTLTTLNINEIVSVLKAHGFNPGSRDVQKKLRELFPSDYTKSYKSYRPPKDRPKTSRLERLRTKHTGDTASSGPVIPCRVQNENTSTTDRLYDPAIFEGPLSAFRGHSAPNAVCAPRILIDGTGSEPESQIMVPSLLLIDGSSITTQPGPEHKDRETSIHGGDRSVARQSLPQSVISTESLAQCLRRSSSILHHVHSVLRFSSTNSWRSSLSFCSMLTSPEVSSSTINFLSENEESVWQELIGETLLNTQFSRRPLYDGFTFQRRHCCGYSHLEPDFVALRCTVCGRHRSHVLAYQGRNTTQTNVRDYFGNTPLHFAAASPNPLCDTLAHLIEHGADVRSLNTSGETFVHTLFTFMDLGALPEWISFLYYLDGLGFPFSARDFHGRTTLHTLVDRQMPKKLTPELLRALLEVVKISKPKLDAVDNLGATISNHLYASRSADLRLTAIAESLTPKGSSTTLVTTFIGSFLKCQHDFARWIKWIAETDTYSWIDSAGDTPLHALTKTIRIDEDASVIGDMIAKLSDAGTSIHMRDRNGETALTVAARRGLRPAVTILVQMGASVHCRDYLGVSILLRARRHLRYAKLQGNDKAYAMILSCMTWLIDMGAVKHPIGLQEWTTPSSPMARDPGLAWNAKITDKLTGILL
ncbi:uncharacterized protein PAC_02481 [Phialocephala subalpina]|uniref:Uncharacterized protein n=1 Tax=Phialocephala subalpina TaxID=576137 RepID=A0A1L7WIJ7_9HELO|nr:uncharacterized protein PAC_02481 [Phialocephala subalpina]